MHEIVTLQFGPRANYLATHWWNVQESYFTYHSPTDGVSTKVNVQLPIVDHDVHFRPGIGVDGVETYMPRALIYDFKTGFGGLRRVNALYDDTSYTDGDGVGESGLWSNNQTQYTIRAPPIPTHPYQAALESGVPTPQLYSSDVRYWSDFNRLYFHPRSIVQLSSPSPSYRPEDARSDASYGASTLSSTESWSAGVDLFNSLDKEVDVLDRDLRLWVEECDSLHAFQIFTSADDGLWGAFTSRYLEAIRDEFGKMSVWVWAIEGGERCERTALYNRLSNSARSLQSMAQSATAYMRLSSLPSPIPSYIQPKLTSEWSKMALLSSVIESVTLPTRLRSEANIKHGNLGLFQDTLNTNGSQNIFNLKATVQKKKDLIGGQNGSSTADLGRRDPRQQNHNGDNGQHLEPNRTGEDTEAEPATFDVDFTPSIPLYSSQSNSNSVERNEHVFAQIETHRQAPTPSHLQPTEPPAHAMDGDVEYERLRRRYNDEAIVETYLTPLPFPLLDSFPADLFAREYTYSTPASRAKAKREVDLDAALATSSSTKKDILALRDVVIGRVGSNLRGVGFGLLEGDERENIYNDLTGLAEGYTFGYEDDVDDEDEEDE